jgi:hypothetical protein
METNRESDDIMGIMLGVVSEIITEVETAGRVYYVSPSGNNSNNGLSLAEPFLTLEYARDIVAAYKISPGLPTGGISIILRDGIYELSTALRINSNNSGESTKPITYKAYQKEVPRIIGGTVIDSNQASLVTDEEAIWSRISASARGNVYKIDLNAQGLSDVGLISDLIDNNVNTAPVELFINGEKQLLAQYPKRGETWLYTDSTLSAGAISYASADATRIESWTAEDIWLCGFFNATYSLEYLDVNTIDSENNKFTVTSHSYCAGTASTEKPYFARNVLEELTESGEYYIKADTKILYFWPTVAIESAEIIISTYGGSLDGDIIRCYGSSYINFENITFECGRRAGLRVDGTNADSITATGCIFRNCGTDGVNITGTNIAIVGSKIYNTNNCAVDIYGGVRASLTHAENRIERTKIHDVGYWKPTSKPAIVCRGVGYLIIKNEIYNTDSAAIVLYGNDHLIQFNNMHECSRWTNDMGYIYTIGTWKFRGHVIRWNYLHGFISNNIHSPSDEDISGIYIDDATSGTKVVSNIVDGAPKYGIRLSGGRDVKITSNVILGSDASVQYDNRVVVRHTNDQGAWDLLYGLASDGVSYQSGVWATNYPECAAIPNDYATIDNDANGWTQPGGSEIARNLNYQCTAFSSHYDYTIDVVMEYIGDNVNNTDPLLTYKNLSAYDVESPVFDIIGFIDFPFGEVGVASFPAILGNNTYYNIYDANF